MSKVGFQDRESFEAKLVKVQIVIITSTFVKYRGEPELISDQLRDEKRVAI